VLGTRSPQIASSAPARTSRTPRPRRLSRRATSSWSPARPTRWRPSPSSAEREERVKGVQGGVVGDESGRCRRASCSGSILLRSPELLPGLT
jgi:hypothetical protein